MRGGRQGLTVLNCHLAFLSQGPYRLHCMKCLTFGHMICWFTDNVTTTDLTCYLHWQGVMVLACYPRTGRGSRRISPECPSLHRVKLCKTPFKNKQNYKNNKNRSCKKINRRPRVINATRKETRVLGGTIIYSRMLRETAVRPES